MCKKILFFCFLFSIGFFFSSIYANTVDAPVLTCISVDANGDVILNWTTPVNTGGSFESYHVYVASNLNGPYTELDSVFSYTQSSYVHIGANPSVPLFYFLKTRFKNPGLTYSNASDTMNTILLHVANASNGTASLSLNKSEATTGNPGLWYKIYREYPSNKWSLLDSTQSLKYVDTISICNSILNYKIEISDISGCASVSSVDGSLFQDITVPVTPEINTVSIDSTGLAIIGWDKNSSKDVEGYIIYQFINGFWTPLDTVLGINTTSYINKKSVAANASEEYRLAAFDSCGNTSPLGDAHKSLFLTTSPDVCNEENTLTWNAYTNMKDIAGYEIYVSINGGSFNLLATNGVNTTTYVHSELIPLTNYRYLVQAYNSSGTKNASSNQLLYYADLPVNPQFAYMRTATVKGENNVEILCFVDTASDIIKYKMLRAESEFGVYSTIASIPASSEPLITFTDLSANTDSKSYYYKLVAVDNCGKDKIVSNIGRTILLTVKENEDMSNTLYWNDYGEWSGLINSYNIYIGIDGVFNPVPIANIPFEKKGENSFTDDISGYINSEGVFSYYIEAVEDTGNIYSFKEISKSNVAEVLQYSNFFVPNAFIPSGINNVFIPKGGFFDKQDYLFSIFNRWGEKIFETNDFSEGWNGTYKNQEVEAGVYVYWIRFRTAKGKFVEKGGAVNLLR